MQARSSPEPRPRAFLSGWQHLGRVADLWGQRWAWDFQLLFDGGDSDWSKPSVTQPPRDDHIFRRCRCERLRACDQDTDTFFITLGKWHRSRRLSHWAPPPAKLSALSFIQPEGEACRPEEVWLILVTRCILQNSLQTCCLLSEEHRREWRREI